MTAGRWAALLVRALAAGAVTGMAAAWLLYFAFGSIGLVGGSLTDRLENGWDAAFDFGIERGLLVGLGIAAMLALGAIGWILATGRLDSRRARPWLAAAAVVVVVAANAPAVEDVANGDRVALLTMGAIALLAAAAVWIAAPWVIRPAGMPLPR